LEVSRVNIGPLLLRIVVGLLFVGHGIQKLFGWFGGHGPKGTGQFMESLGYKPGVPMATLAGLAEAGGGLLLALGFLTPLAAAAIIGVMTNAILSVHLPKGIWNSEGGLEFPLVMATAATAVVFTGAGKWSLDRAFGWELSGWKWGLAAVALGLVVGVVLFAASAGRTRRRRAAPGEGESRTAA
jgi:putative oxidoreductase